MNQSSRPLLLVKAVDQIIRVGDGRAQFSDDDAGCHIGKRHGVFHGHPGRHGRGNARHYRIARARDVEDFLGFRREVGVVVCVPDQCHAVAGPGREHGLNPGLAR